MKSQIITDTDVRQYRERLRQAEKAAATVEKYSRDITAFAAYLDGKPLTKDRAIAYKQQLKDGGYAARSINSVIASLNGFFAYLGRHDCKLKTLKIQRQAFCEEEKQLTKAEYTRLVQAARQAGDDRLALVIQTICGMGIRVSELPFITAEAVRRGYAVVSLKGKTRTVFIVAALQQKLLRYVTKQRISHGAVFVTRTGKPLSRTNIWRDMKRLCTRAGVNPSKVFPHNLRRLFARTFYGIEKDIAKLADILGHSSVDTTRIYIVTTGAEHRRRMETMRLIV